MKKTLTDAQLLVKYGFINDKGGQYYKFDEKKGYYVPNPKSEKDPDNYYEAHAEQEIDEEANLSWNNQYYSTRFPKPGWRLKLVHEAFNLSMEEMYYWSIGHIRQDAGFPFMLKVTDIFSASENSAFFGQSQYRLSIQEDRASGFLRGISELVKTLFQIVRELRNIDERLQPYDEWKKTKSADATLKGFFADFAENKGGQVQPGSIYHLANQVGYSVLPDLFFNTTIYSTDKIDGMVDSLSVNKNVKAVLKRKMYQFIVWKEKTEIELKARRKFQIKYLRQHYLVIKTYIGWVKPYLRHIKRLTMNEEKLDSPELVSSFESSNIEIENIAYKPLPKTNMNSVVLMSYEFNTRPTMQYRQENYQGPIHVGRGIMTLRAYAWTDDQIKMYKKMRDYEDLELLSLVDDQLKAAMEMLGSDLDQYIKEAEGTIEEEVKPKKGQKETFKPIGSGGTVFDPFVDVAKGFGDIFSLMIPSGLFSKKSSGGSKSKGDPKKALKGATIAMWMVYNNYKKAHGLLSW
ncbi:hypothetical protein K9L67_00630 [Candidatus Woesearchaeota archaeon]|nr:hypothetical protein [Candidatus Woesearchaeota archaeon]MCF7900712.1 hypothetical protein [Candidatus Woesearchaeota archaeon]MCF8013233.1 hypothetical protein [Candidatus Woesearchaeota archaeon]